MKGRAKTPEQKREIMERILAVWMTVPDLRLGQLVNGTTRDAFYIEDYELAEIIELYKKG